MKRKSVIALLTLVTSLTMTACSFQFNKKDIKEQISDTFENIYVEIENAIDKADFSSDSDISELTQEINEWASENEQLGEFQKATLVRVVDGDTIVVDIEGEEYSVRLIGVNTPESVHPDSSRNGEEGMLASDYTKNLLKDTKVVYLQKDTSETDKYDRLLRYVWLELPENENNINEIATKMLNGLLLLDHVAEVATYEPDVTHKEDFEWIYDNM